MTFRLLLHVCLLVVDCGFYVCCVCGWLRFTPARLVVVRTRLRSGYVATVAFHGSPHFTLRLFGCYALTHSAVTGAVPLRAVTHLRYARSTLVYQLVTLYHVRCYGYGCHGCRLIPGYTLRSGCAVVAVCYVTVAALRCTDSHLHGLPVTLVVTVRCWLRLFTGCLRLRCCCFWLVTFTTLVYVVTVVRLYGCDAVLPVTFVLTLVGCYSPYVYTAVGIPFPLVTLIHGYV